MKIQFLPKNKIPELSYSGLYTITKYCRSHTGEYQLYVANVLLPFMIRIHQKLDIDF